jgi:hypothetical protein
VNIDAGKNVHTRGDEEAHNIDIKQLCLLD